MGAGSGGVFVYELKSIPRHNAWFGRSTFDGQLLLVKSSHIRMVMKVIVESYSHASPHILCLEREVVVRGDLRTWRVQHDLLHIW